MNELELHINDFKYEAKYLEPCTTHENLYPDYPIGLINPENNGMFQSSQISLNLTGYEFDGDESKTFDYNTN